MVKALKQNINVLVDRCNAHAKERKMWFHDMVEAKLENVQLEAFFLNTPIDVCKQRVLTRKNHPNLMGEQGAVVIDQFVKNMEGPNQREVCHCEYITNIIGLQAHLCCHNTRRSQTASQIVIKSKVVC